MRLVKTSWLLHGESPFPGWALLALLVASVAVSIWWLRGERRRKGVAGARLPYTWTLLLMLVAWLAWKPTLVRIMLWAHEADILVCLDDSESMRAELQSGDLTTDLDFLRLWHPDATQGRETSARELRTALSAALGRGVQLRQKLTAVSQELLQEVPLGAASHSSRNEYNEWASASKATLRDALAQVHAAVDSLTHDQRASLSPPVKELDGLAKQVELLPGAIKHATVPTLRSTLQSLEALIASGNECLPKLQSFQTALDRLFVARHREKLEPLLSEQMRRSRMDAAEEILAGIREARPTAVCKTGQREGTDLYGAVERLLADREDEIISHLLVVSDGGHHGAPTSDVAGRLKKSGIDVVTVGIGSPESGWDLSFLDWQAPRVVRAGEAMSLEVTIKTPLATEVSFRLVLASSDKELASMNCTTSGHKAESFPLECKSPAPGRHALSLRIEAEDTNPRNNQVQFAIDAVKRTPKGLLLGEAPDWDTTYLALALNRAGFSGRQFYHALAKKTPGPEDTPWAVPKSLTQWHRNRLVILQGRPFIGFTKEDASSLFRYVTEQGGSLLIMANGGASCVEALAGQFGWQGSSRALERTRVRLAPSFQFLPLVRLAADGPQSARIIRSLGMCGRASRVPAQHCTLLEDQNGAPLLSLGFYGKGKVYLWGLEETYRLREYGNSARVDRFLDQLVADAVAPLFPDEEAKLATYPAMPVAGRENILISVAGDAEHVLVSDTEGKRPKTKDQRPETEDGTQREPRPKTQDPRGAHGRSPLRAGVGNRIATFTPLAPGPATASVGQAELQFQSAANPGMEEIYYEFNESFLSDFAKEAGGRYVPLPAAPNELRSLHPATWHSSTAVRYPLADHWVLMCLIAVLGALHWSLRKISGLPI